LGPSGCGKTTVLRTIVSKVRLDDGDVLVFNKEPGSAKSGIPGPVVGYMPQEIALYNEFTIEETLNFFGYLHSMKKDDLERQKDFLFNFLDLPKFKNSMVKNLSGGQKRRVSMMCALLQEPKLLILGNIICLSFKNLN
jgi:ABC-type multidrug transport system ATPase subunit